MTSKPTIRYGYTIETAMVKQRKAVDAGVKNLEEAVRSSSLAAFFGCVITTDTLTRT